MVGGLRAHVLRIGIEASEPMELDEHPGSSLRGALFNALLRRFCTNPSARTCAECPLNLTCPVSSLVAPLRDEAARGQDVPRPFVLAPTIGCSSPRGAEYDQSARRYLAAGEAFSFDLTIFGQAARLFPYVALSMPTLEALGLGRRMATLGGRRGRPRVMRIDEIDPFESTGEQRMALYRRAEPKAHAPTLAITAAEVRARAASLPVDRLHVRFLTPARLIAEGQLVRRPDFHVLARRLVERLEALEREYGESAGAGSDTFAMEDQRTRYLRLGALAEGVQLVQDETRWVDVASYSARQGRATPIGGIVGSAVFEGELTEELRELLVWGEIIHVGKNAVKGDGLVCVEAG